MSWLTGIQPLALGAVLPAVSCPDQNGVTVPLAELGRRGLLLIFFFPKAGTPGCVAEACSLRDAFADLTRANLTVVGVSRDRVSAQKQFVEKQRLPFTVLADTRGEVYRAFGVPTRCNRQSFLFQDGKLVWRDLAAATAQHAADVQRVLAQLSGA
jgi:peroxiredoxin Q/BCP